MDAPVCALRNYGYSSKHYHKFLKYIASFLLPACGEEQARGVSRRRRPATPGAPEESRRWSSSA